MAKTIKSDLRDRASKKSYDAVVIGSGPNGLVAAIALAQAGLSVLVVEAHEKIGGGARSAELAGKGFVSDVCSAIHPTALVSPYLRTLPLADHGLEWVFPPAAVAHPLPDGTAAVLERSFDDMKESLGEDAEAWRALISPLSSRADELFPELLAPIGPMPPKSPLLMARFGMSAWRSAFGLAKGTFKKDQARALFAGCAAHSFLPLEQMFTAAFGLVLATAGHAVGWPVARGGSQMVVDAMASLLGSLGGEIVTGFRVEALEECPEARAYLFDLAPRAMAKIAGERFPLWYQSQLQSFRHGPGSFKVDWALDGPIPWKAKGCTRAATVHVGGTIDELAASERACWTKTPSESPFVLVAQQSLFDDTRAPPGKQVGWAYCHVPAGCEVDMTDRIEAQIQRFAPGFKDRILERAVMTPGAFESYNANYVAGDIGGGANDIVQLLARPALRLDPHSTPNRALYICSSSTPPGGGVHGMCGFFAAKSALATVFGKQLDLPR